MCTFSTERTKRDLHTKMDQYISNTFTFTKCLEILLIQIVIWTVHKNAPYSLKKSIGQVGKSMVQIYSQSSYAS